MGHRAPSPLIFWAGFPDGTDADPCAGLPIWPPPTSAADLAAAVAGVPGIEVVSGPSDVTVGGLDAKHVVHIVREDIGCDPGFFYNWKAKTGGALWETTDPGATIRIWIVDMDGTLFIEAETTKQAGPEVEREIQQIVRSIRFD